MHDVTARYAEGWKRRSLNGNILEITLFTHSAILLSQICIFYPRNTFLLRQRYFYKSSIDIFTLACTNTQTAPPRGPRWYLANPSPRGCIYRGLMIISKPSSQVPYTLFVLYIDNVLSGHRGDHAITMTQQVTASQSTMEARSIIAHLVILLLISLDHCGTSSDCKYGEFSIFRVCFFPRGHKHCER